MLSAWICAIQTSNVDLRNTALKINVYDFQKNKINTDIIIVTYHVCAVCLGVGGDKWALRGLNSTTYIKKNSKIFDHSSNL